MEPLLLLLLTPSTARVSVQHINVQRASETDQEDRDDLGRVYAISSVEGTHRTQRYRSRRRRRALPASAVPGGGLDFRPLRYVAVVPA